MTSPAQAPTSDSDGAAERTDPPRGQHVGAAARFTVAFAVAALCFGALSWGRSGAAYQLPDFARAFLAGHGALLFFAAFVVHMGVHAAFGALAALPTGRPHLIGATATASMLLDSDHIGGFLALPMLMRASHSVGFLAMAPLVLPGVMLGRRGFTPVTTAALTLGAVLSHLSWDALSSPGIPFLYPFTITTYAPSLARSAALEGVAVAIVALGVLLDPARRRLSRG